MLGTKLANYSSTLTEPRHSGLLHWWLSQWVGGHHFVEKPFSVFPHFLYECFAGGSCLLIIPHIHPTARIPNSYYYCASSYCSVTKNPDGHISETKRAIENQGFSGIFRCLYLYLVVSVPLSERPFCSIPPLLISASRVARHQKSLRE